jgi:hypothetical protein
MMANRVIKAPPVMIAKRFSSRKIIADVERCKLKLPRCSGINFVVQCSQLPSRHRRLRLKAKDNRHGNRKVEPFINSTIATPTHFGKFLTVIYHSIPSLCRLPTPKKFFYLQSFALLLTKNSISMAATTSRP